MSEGTLDVKGMDDVPDVAIIQRRKQDEDVWEPCDHPMVDGEVSVGDMKELDVWPILPRLVRATDHDVRFKVPSGEGHEGATVSAQVITGPEAFDE